MNLTQKLYKLPANADIETIQMPLSKKKTVKSTRIFEM